MIHKTTIPLHLPKDEFLSWLGQNKALLAYEKRMAGKNCDAVLFSPSGEVNTLHIKDAAGKLFNPYSKGPISSSTKADSLPEYGKDLYAKLAINSTNWMDSHMDVHMPGLWKKSLQENKMLMHLQEHAMQFDKIIADGADLKGSTKNFTWKSLGMNYPGSTELLIFDSTIKQSRNAFMYDQYYRGYVKNHSVYIQYVKYVLCVNEPNDNDWGAEYEAWQKYFPEVANKDFAEETGFFWAVLEGKIVEGSAVPRGSNIVTPTLSISSKSVPPDESTRPPEPVKSTQKAIQILKTKNIFE